MVTDGDSSAEETVTKAWLLDSTADSNTTGRLLATNFLSRTGVAWSAQ